MSWPKGYPRGGERVPLQTNTNTRLRDSLIENVEGTDVMQITISSAPTPVDCTVPSKSCG